MVWNLSPEHGTQITFWTFEVEHFHKKPTGELVFVNRKLYDLSTDERGIPKKFTITKTAKDGTQTITQHDIFLPHKDGEKKEIRWEIKQETNAIIQQIEAHLHKGSRDPFR